MYESQVFDPKVFSLSSTALIPPDDNLDEDDEELTADWLAYRERSKHLDVDDLMATVGDSFSNTDILRELVEQVQSDPFKPGERKRLHISDCIRLGEAVMELIATAMDDAIGLRAVVEGEEHAF